MDLNIVQAAEQLLYADDILLLAHRSPDGDTIGSCFALYYALRGIKKRVRIECADPFPRRYGYFTEGVFFSEFEPRFIVAVDVADRRLLGEKDACYPNIDLCIDHHLSNTGYAARRLLDPSQAATAQLCFSLLSEMRLPITPQIADCLFTGLTTDTGGFRFSNVTAQTHRIAAELMALGCDAAGINRQMFECKSRSRIQVERLAMESLEYAFDGRCALLCISQKMRESSGACEEDLEGVAGLPRQIEGVWVGITCREREEGYRISLRADEHIDASAVCRLLDGGGHKQAAGCTLQGDFAAVRAKLLDTLAPFIRAAQDQPS
ncbi:MAG: bifunctional oligoribonuclease/PAP phosphatase NrnA [Provencibacterium sp.]|jgi:phosphoesterase RecJ-like protein|nr:bifunctional oligoribonuclease/PAP phosphatase NrnA [Provencibacterium sp.]